VAKLAENIGIQRTLQVQFMRIAAIDMPPVQHSLQKQAEMGATDHL